MYLPGRPATDEYAEFFAGYIERVPEGDLLAMLRTQMEQMVELLAPLSREQQLARPTPEDWNVLEVLGHIIDGEIAFSYRAWRIAHGDTTPLAGFEQDDYVRTAESSKRTLEDLLEAYTAQRQATIMLYRSFDQQAWMRRGVVAGHPCSARSWGYVTAGHELHHLADFHERYGL
ncbi:MAG: DinB family protein [Roseiflexaceae bacterium]